MIFEKNSLSAHAKHPTTAGNPTNPINQSGNPLSTSTNESEPLMIITATISHSITSSRDVREHKNLSASRENIFEDEVL